MKRGFFLTVILIGLYSGTYAQWSTVGFVKGSLKTLAGDSLVGWVNPEDKYVLFETEKQADVVKFDIQDIAFFSLADGKFAARNVEVLRGNFPERTFSFLRVVVEGKLSLLEYSGKDRYGNFYSNYFLEDAAGNLRRMDKRGFKKKAAYYFSDSEEVKGMITSGQFDYDSLPAIVIEFNKYLETIPAPTPNVD